MGDHLRLSWWYRWNAGSTAVGPQERRASLSVPTVDIRVRIRQSVKQVMYADTGPIQCSDWDWSVQVCTVQHWSSHFWWSSDSVPMCVHEQTNHHEMVHSGSACLCASAPYRSVACTQVPPWTTISHERPQCCTLFTRFVSKFSISSSRVYDSIETVTVI